MMRNGMIRTKQIRFAQVSNEALRDPDLSLGAKGLYALIQSYVTIPDFVIYKNTLKKCCIEGETAFEGRWQELKQKGYLIQYKIKDKKSGKFYYEYDLLDEKKVQKTNKKSAKKESQKQAEVLKNSESYHPPKNHPLDNPPSGKVGGYSYTDSTYTYSIKSVSQSGSKKTTDRQTDRKKEKADRKKLQEDPAALEAILDTSGLSLYTGDYRKALEEAFRALWTRPSINHQGRLLDRVQIREQLRRIDLDALDWACWKYSQALQAPAGVTNHAAYLQTIILSAPDDAPAAAMAAYADL